MPEAHADDAHARLGEDFLSELDEFEDPSLAAK
jgi:hypothetical protein